MSTFKKHIKSVTLILSVLILFQGCSVYKSTPISLEKASGIEGKVKVITKSNDRLKFKQISQENGNYYGINRKMGRQDSYFRKRN